MFKYFVSYKGEGGFGSCEVCFHKIIMNTKDLTKIAEKLTQEHGVKYVIIIDYHLLGRTNKGKHKRILEKQKNKQEDFLKKLTNL